MENSGDDSVRQSAKVIRANVFFEPEYRELTLALFNMYTPDKMSRGFLRDLVEANHVFLKIMEHMAKSKHLVVGKRMKKRAGGGGKKKKGERDHGYISLQTSYGSISLVLFYCRWVKARSDLRRNGR